MTMTVEAARAALTGAGLDLAAAALPTKSEVFVVCGSQARHLAEAIETILLDHTRVSTETIVAAAIRLDVPEEFREQTWMGKRCYPDKLTVTSPPPARHHTLMHPIPESYGDGVVDTGFITSTGRFVERAEALQIALKSGQPMIDHPSRHDTQLFSEDLW